VNNFVDYSVLFFIFSEKISPKFFIFADFSQNLQKKIPTTAFTVFLTSLGFGKKFRRLFSLIFYFLEKISPKFFIFADFSQNLQKKTPTTAFTVFLTSLGFGKKFRRLFSLSFYFFRQNKSNLYFS